ncbi:hypothetical protein [Helicobacter sp. 11S02629-2]|uniref:hypothetical protein n=1 Tax=Helicobacter sp. 11S02629-2 TaxID=1476195 RepID=UPI0015DA067A|nr:hypothetical protein [Helicobacter sp. 11S02629-2]
MLDATTLSNLIATDLTAKGFKIENENKAFIEALCKAIISHVTSSGVINVTVTTNTGTGTGIGTIS